MQLCWVMSQMIQNSDNSRNVELIETSKESINVVQL